MSVLNCAVVGLGIIFAIFYPHVGHIVRYDVCINVALPDTCFDRVD